MRPLAATEVGGARGGAGRGSPVTVIDPASGAGQVTVLHGPEHEVDASSIVGSQPTDRVSPAGPTQA